MDWKGWALFACGLIFTTALAGAHVGDGGFHCHTYGAPCYVPEPTTDTPPPPQPDTCTDETNEEKPACGGGCPPTGTDKPISLVSGRKFMAETDMVIKGVYPIELVRRYSSQSTYDSPLGYGWAFTHDMQLVDYTAGGAVQKEKILRTSCGVRSRYADSGGVFSAPAGSRTTLVVNGPGHSLTYPGGRKVHFDAMGLVEAFEDPQGNQLEFDYDPPGPGTANLYDLVGTSPAATDPTRQQVVAKQYRIKTISEKVDGQLTGRSVTFDYDANGRLLTATSHDGRVVTYTTEVDGTTVTGNLKEVTGLENITTTYRYDDPTDGLTPYDHRLAFIRRGQDTETLHNHYDSVGRVRSQSRGDPELIDDPTNSAYAETELLSFDYSTPGQTTVTTSVYDGTTKLHDVKTVYRYDSAGLISEIESQDPASNDALLRKTVYTRKTTGLPVEIGLIERIEVFDSTGTNKTRRVDFSYHPNGFLHTKKTYIDIDEVTGAVNDTGTGETITEKRTWDGDSGWLASIQIESSDPSQKVFRTEFTFYRGGLSPDDGGYSSSLPPENIYKIRRRKEDLSFLETTLEYDASGQISKITQPDGHEIKRTYYELTDPSIGRRGMPHEAQHLDPGTEEDHLRVNDHLRVRWDYDSRGNVKSVVDARGIVGVEDNYKTEIGWDDRGRVTALTNPLDEVTTFTYTAPTYGSPPAIPGSAPPGEYLSLVVRTAGGDTQETRRHHDEFGDLRQVDRLHDGSTWTTFRTIRWDSEGRELFTSRSRESGDDETFDHTYDLLGRRTETVDARNFETEFGYDTADNRVLVTEAAHDTQLEADTVYHHDGLNRLTKVSQQGVTPFLETSFGYDPIGNTASVTDPRQNTTIYHYDTLGRLTQVQRPLDHAMGGTAGVEYQWDDRNRLSKITNVRGQVRDFVYNEWGPLERVIHVGSPNREVVYSYDLAGNKTQISDSDLDLDSNPLTNDPMFTTVYDALNRVDDTDIHYVPGNAVSLDSGYDGFGNRNHLTLTDAGLDYGHDWTYDERNRLETAEFGKGAPLPDPASLLSFEYYDNDDLKKITHGNGVTTDYTYDANGPVNTITVTNSSSTQLHKLDYTTNARLNVTQIAEELGTTSLVPDWVYEYDPVSRLTGVTSYPTVTGAPNLPASDSFPYDAAGNRDDDPGSATPWRYNDNNEIDESPTFKYFFDADGNLCKRVPSSAAQPTTCSAGAGTEARFTYDYSNRLRRIDRADGSTVTYRYDPFGRRIEKTVSGVTTWFVWDGDQLLGEYDATGSRTIRYTYGHGSSPLQVLFPATGGAEDLYQVHADHLDMPRMQTGSTESVDWRLFPEAFGKSYSNSGVGIALNIRFPGQYYDEETEQWDGTSFVPLSGLHYNRHRDYDPLLGRFGSTDPIGQLAILREEGASRSRSVPDSRMLDAPTEQAGVGGFGTYDTNLYVYARLSPMSIVDPTGEFGVGGAAAGAAFNASVQFATNYSLSGGDWRLSLRCINLVDVGISAALGFGLPTFLSNVLKGKPGPWGWSRLKNTAVWATGAVGGFGAKTAAPSKTPSDFGGSSPGCEDPCSGLQGSDLASRLSHLF